MLRNYLLGVLTFILLMFSVMNFGCDNYASRVHYQTYKGYKIIPIDNEMNYKIRLIKNIWSTPTGKNLLLALKDKPRPDIRLVKVVTGYKTPSSSFTGFYSSYDNIIFIICNYGIYNDTYTLSHELTHLLLGQIVDSYYEEIVATTIGDRVRSELINIKPFSICNTYKFIIRNYYLPLSKFMLKENIDDKLKRYGLDIDSIEGCMK